MWKRWWRAVAPEQLNVTRGEWAVTRYVEPRHWEVDGSDTSSACWHAHRIEVTLCCMRGREMLMQPPGNTMQLFDRYLIGYLWRLFSQSDYRQAVTSWLYFLWKFNMFLWADFKEVTVRCNHNIRGQKGKRNNNEPSTLGMRTKHVFTRCFHQVEGRVHCCCWIHVCSYNGCACLRQIYLHSPCCPEIVFIVSHVGYKCHLN